MNQNGLIIWIKNDYDLRKMLTDWFWFWFCYDCWFCGFWFRSFWFSSCHIITTDHIKWINAFNRVISSFIVSVWSGTVHRLEWVIAFTIFNSVILTKTDWSYKAVHSVTNAEAFTKERFLKGCQGDFGTWSNFVKISDFKSIAY